MKLSLKATRLVIEALEYHLKHYDQRLEDEALSEDDASDLANDRQYLESIKREFEKYRDDFMQEHEAVKADA